MKNINTKLILAFSIALSAGSYAAPQISGKVVHESAKFTSDGNLIGNTSTGATIPNNKDVFKTETAIKVYVDGEINELKDGSTYHIELQGYNNGKAITNYDGNESDTQRETLREAYIDTTINDWAVRTGKQQVVWGTADGIKLLDAINPTDYSELVQNQMEDSRIPVWMINAVKTLEDGGDFQVIVSAAKENKIPGLNATGDVGHPFIMKGVDSITGKYNGFYSVAPNLAGVASTFNYAAENGAFATSASTQSATLANFTGMTVDGFAGYGAWDAASSAGMILSPGQTDGTNNYGDAGTTSDGGALLYAIAENGFGAFTTYANNGETNLADSTWNSVSPDAAFEYMPMATFATFNTMAGATSSYVKDYSSVKENVGLRYSNTTKGGLNYSLNAMKRYDSNPYIDLSWRDRSSGEKLTTVYVQGGASPIAAGGAGPNVTDGGLPVDSSGINGTVVSAADIETDLYTTAISAGTAATMSTAIAGDASMVPYLQGSATKATTVLLKDSNGNYYGINAWDLAGGANTYNDVDLRFTEKLNEVTSIGGSFDTSIETDALGPVVIRGEALYTKDEMMPVIDRKVLAIGDLAGALTMQKSDTFKYVLGVDITALTNMMISTQFIQMRNLDFVDSPATCTTVLNNSVNCGKYTADMATLHMSNDLKKGTKNKEFYSLFLTKPFGESDQHRWNNIFMFEEGGGKWNRLDVEYTVNDNTVATAEFNKYFGDENTQFGQFKNSSNVQVGLKYSF